jgi:hypothetical protein
VLVFADDRAANLIVLVEVVGRNPIAHLLDPVATRVVAVAFAGVAAAADAAGTLWVPVLVVPG